MKYSNSIWDVKFVGLDVDFEEILSFHIAIHFLIFAPVFYLHSESKASIVGGNPFSDEYVLSQIDPEYHRTFTVSAKNVFDDGDDVLFNAELYNDALELVNTPDVSIDLKSKTGKTYSFIFTRNGQSYQLNAGGLPADEYTFSAKAKLGNKSFTAAGQFLIKPLNAETRQSAADHHLLYSIAQQNGGEMLLPNQMDKLADLIRKNENIKTLVYDDKTYKDLIDEKWLFVLILTLLSTEWFLRKREGEV